jgi:hypothetical protein
MLTAEDKVWLQGAHPGLTLNGDGVVGKVRFRAAYNAAINLFLIGEPDTTEAGYTILDCDFPIRIAEREELVYSALPALYIEGADPNLDRHISYDKSACLCSPLEEAEFLAPQFPFRPYFEKLVLPFLYGQAYFSLHGRWPWPEYAHSVVGILESYSKYPGADKVRACLDVLMKCKIDWPAVQSALSQRDYVKGHTPCFCKKKDQIRRCHPGALQGIQRLRREIIELGIQI